MDGKPLVLVVDDDENIRELIQIYLEDEFTLIFAANGHEAVEKAITEKPDLILLDIMLPQKNGWEVCKEIRALSNIPILMVSAKGEEIDKILGLELGADDYITKPFSPRELLARVKAHIRRNNVLINQIVENRTGQIETISKINEEFCKGDLIINNRNYLVKSFGQEIELTVKEFELLNYLAKNEGQVFTRDQLLEKIWGFDYFGDSRAVDQTIKRLRKKIKNTNNQSYIHTIWGIGYKFEVPK